VSTQVRGTIGSAAYEEAPQAEFTGMALEYGTYPPEMVMQALRADQWMQNHPAQAVSQREAIRRQLRDVFYVDATDWKEQVFEQGREAAWQAVQGLSQQG
jgi:predicted RNase H-like nuclease